MEFPLEISEREKSWKIPKCTTYRKEKGPPHGLNKRQVRLWNWGSGGFDDRFFSIKLWPRWAQVSFLKGHLGNDERFKLAIFLLGNGMAPWMLLDVVLSTDLVHNRLRYDGYNRHAFKQMEDMIPLAINGALWKGFYSVLSLKENRVIKM